MAYHNRLEVLEKSLAAYHKLYDDIEISIIDDRSRPPLEHRDDAKVGWILGTPEARNPCVPLNLAVHRSSADLIVLTNPEILHREPILAQMSASLESDNDYVIAACKDHDGRWLEYSKAKYPYRLERPKGSGFHFCTMLTRKLWEETGGFDEDYRWGQGAEDHDFLRRLEKAGANFIMRDDLVVIHQKAPSCKWVKKTDNRQLLKQKWNL